MSEHYDRHRHDAEELAGFAAARGLLLSPERAYRAWIDHSESMAAGWIIHDTMGDDADITFAILEGAERRLRDEDAALLEEKVDDTEYLVTRAEILGLNLIPEVVVGVWADHCASRGIRWEAPDDRELDRVLEAHRLIAPEGTSIRP